jgi:hypothetical protein
MEKKHTSINDDLAWAKRFIEGQFEDGGINQFKLGRGYINFNTSTKRFMANLNGTKEYLYEELNDCLALFSNADIIDCAKKMRLLQETYHEKPNPGETFPPPTR